MNNQLQSFARTSLKSDLATLPEGWQRKFKLMYGRAGGMRSVEDSCAMDINEVVDEIPDEKLDWAMQQVDNSIKKLSEAAKENQGVTA